jgi:hypothetical protein
MKTFEEKWTAWIDEKLTGRELIEFEAALPDRAAAEAEKRQAKKLGLLLKQELGLAVLHNEDFFSHQLRERIQHEDASGSREGRAARLGAAWWSLRRLAWAGATALVLFAAVAVFVLGQREPVQQSEYLTQILQAKVDPTVSPNATITTFEARKSRVTVLWTEGLKSLPADYAAK